MLDPRFEEKTFLTTVAQNEPIYEKREIVDDMVADVVTKPLTGAKFIYLRSLLLNCTHEA